MFHFPKSSPEALAVLMVRQNLDPGSAYADAAIHGDGHFNLQFRAVADAKIDDTLSIEQGDSSPIERKGNLFTVFAGEPGQADACTPGDDYHARSRVCRHWVCAHNANAFQR